MGTLAKAIRIARKREVPTFEAMAFGYLGTVLFWYGNWTASINNCRQCIGLSRKLDNALPIIWGTFFKGAALFNSGRQPEGLTVMGQSIDMMANVDSVLAMRFFYALFAENLALHRKYRRAETINKKAMALGQSGQRWGDIASCRAMAILAAAQSRPDWHQVAGHMQKSIDLSPRAEAIPELVVSLSRFSDLMLKKGDLDSAHAYHRQAKKMAAAIGGKGLHR
ncbi:hypothetical protein DSCA_28890 [Desulfosarcina alkanivorans]|uniref:MalT-like TPR region domain-containing protein n=1 Tax=Desulfosarcina alkanivorans TaxID=571177 RepID=A0A5K7YM78_9BACT|nr:hypothetical protein [Desulfosarcina alkanivorans]BBO68959.1 hypothetical protein DSCA_28890 [Desulfosarcina alkanivorans]